MTVVSRTRLQALHDWMNVPSSIMATSACAHGRRGPGRRGWSALRRPDCTAASPYMAGIVLLRALQNQHPVRVARAVAPQRPGVIGGTGDRRLLGAVRGVHPRRGVPRHHLRLVDGDAVRLSAVDDREG